MHVVDWFTTIVRAAGAEPPGDRVIDGIDQFDWLTGATDESAREGYLYWMRSQLCGVKWRNFTLVLVSQMHMQEAALKLPTPRLINLVTDPQERETVALPHLHTWAAAHMTRIIGQFEASTKREQPIPAGSPIDHTPAEG